MGSGGKERRDKDGGRRRSSSKKSGGGRVQRVVEREYEESRHTLATFHCVEENHLRLLDKLGAEVERRQRQLSERIVEDHSRQIRQLQRDLDRLEAQCVELQKRYDVERARLRGDVKDLAPRLEAGLKSHRDRIAKMREAHEGRVQPLLRKVSELRSEVAQVRRDGAAQQAKIDTSPARSPQRRTQERNRQRQPDNREALENVLRQSRRRIRQKRGQTESEALRMRQDYDEKSRVLYDELTDRTVEYKELQKRLQEMISRHQETISDYERDVEEMTAELNSPEDEEARQRTNIEKHIDELKHELVVAHAGEDRNTEGATRKVGHFLSEKRAEMADQQRLLNAERLELRRRMGLVYDRILETERNRDDAVAWVKQETKRLEENIETATEDVEALRDAKKEMERKSQNAEKRESTELSEKERELTDRLQRLEEKEEALKKEHGRRKATLESAIDRRHDEIEESIDAISGSDERDLQRIAELHSQIQDSKLRRRLTRDLSKAIKEDETVEDTLVDKKHRTELDCYKQQILDKEAEIKRLQQKLEGEEEDHGMKQLLDRGKAKLQSQQREVNELEATIKRLSDVNEELGKAVEGTEELFQNEIEDMKAMVSELDKETDAERERVIDALQNVRDNFYEDLVRYNERIATAIKARSQISKEFEDAVTHNMTSRFVYESSEGQATELQRLKAELERRVAELRKKLEELETKMKAAEKAQHMYVRRSEEEQERATAPLRRKKDDTLKRHAKLVKNLPSIFAAVVDDGEPRQTSQKEEEGRPSGFAAQLPERDAGAGTPPPRSSTAQHKIQLQILRADNDRLEKVCSHLDQKMVELEEAHEKMKRRASQQAARRKEASSGGENDIDSSLNRSKVEKDGEIRELLKESETLRKEIAKLKKMRNALLHSLLFRK